MVAAILPHGSPLRFVTEVVRDGVRWEARARVEGGPAVSGGRIRPAYLIEIAVQAAAAGAGSLHGEAVSGVLVAVRGWRDLAPVLVPAELTIVVIEDAILGSAARYSVEVSDGGRLVAQGSLQVQRDR